MRVILINYFYKKKSNQQIIRHTNILGHNRRKKVSIIGVGGPPQSLLKLLPLHCLRPLPNIYKSSYRIKEKEKKEGRDCVLREPEQSQPKVLHQRSHLGK